MLFDNPAFHTYYSSSIVPPSPCNALRRIPPKNSDFFPPARHHLQKPVLRQICRFSAQTLSLFAGNLPLSNFLFFRKIAENGT